ncbi:MAG TPA: amino acid adenylation domain-containing protein, partial [Thermoanaerobaculia bacterium]|nr:amino acid adenylation domain-containing protein [Thermoanaerobaculia bacterium]
MSEPRKNLSALSADKLRLLMERMREKAQAAAPRIGRAPRDGTPLPLSFGQERFWFLDRLAPGNAAYNMPVAARLAGPLDQAALIGALVEVTRRHEALRTTFGEVDGAPRQEIRPAEEAPLPLVDLAGLPAGRREPEMLRLAGEEVRRAFDLIQGPLLRAVLYKLGSEEHTFLLNLHHIVADGWSLGVLLRELGTLYPSRAAGRPSPLPDLPVQYADYAIWQRERFQGELLESELAFWRDRLAGVPPLELPADRPRPATASFRGGQGVLALNAGETRGLRELARGEESTLYMVLLGLFQALLLRYTGQTDFAVGSPVANRDRREIEGLIGLFINTVVLRAGLGGDPPVRELLRRVREATLAAYAHAELPFEKLVEELEPERQPGRNPLFQVLLTLQNQPLPVMRIGGLDLLPFEVGTGTAKLDLSVIWREEGEGLRGGFEHSADLFEDTTAERLRRHYGALLRSAVASPDRRLSERSMLSPEELRQRVAEWNEAPAEDLGTGTLHERFAFQAARSPEAVAAVCDGASLTYGDLDRRANQIANHLVGRGILPGDLVGLRLERSLEMVAAILGVLKAGAAYVPLDPAYPAERLAFMIEDSGVAATLDTETLAGIAGDASNPQIPVSAGHPAYVIYTSGAPGRPKGVVVRHGNVTRLFSATDRWFGFGPGDVWTLFHSYAFDFSVWEVWGALLYGGRLVVVPYWVSRSPEAFHELLRDERVTVLNQTPSAFRQLIWAGEGKPADLALRYVVFGGEALEPASLAPWFERHGDERPRLINMYGITETTVHVTYRELSRRDTASAIGRPIPDLGVYLLDPALNLVPVGVPGEIFVGGAGLALGYLNRPELTAERFVPNPFGEPGSRLYRSGDLARRLSGGDLEYLGRIDHQVKIRGFRIELGEIEAALARHPAVREAVALVREDRLVAWVVPAEGAAPKLPDLRAFAGASLPDYMLPSALVVLDKLPLTPNGKVDRKALERLAAASGEQEAARESRPPRTPLEELVAGVWSELLDLPAVGAEDDFFDLGGHSLLATRVVSRLRSTLGVELPLRVLFERPTVAAVAELVREQLRAAAPPVLPPIRGEALALSFAQTRLWFLDRLEPGNPAYNVPAALRVTGGLSIPAFAAALREIARRHETLRTTFVEIAGEPALVIHEEPGLPLPVIDLTRLPAGRREAEAFGLAREEARLPFDLQRGPVARAALLRLDVDDHLALFTFHHIVSDAWSAGVLARELRALYQAFAAGRPSPLPELPVQYASFAAAQREWLRGEALEPLLTFWRDRLANPPAPLELPFDRPRHSREAHRGAAEPLALGDDLVAAVGNLGRRHGATLFMTLLAAFETLLHRYTGREDFTLGTLVANRDRAEIEGLIGFFVNTLVLRADLAGNPVFGDLLGRVREAALGAYAHQDLPFERLVEELLPERSLARTPLFQILFTLQGEPLPDLDLGPGLSATLLETGAAPAKLALSLHLGSGRDGWCGELKYDAALFDRATLQRMAGHFQVLLAGIAAAADAPVSDLPLLTMEERRQALMDWNESGPVMAGRPIHETLAEHAARVPDATALVAGEESLTFRELDERANRLAHRLRRLGIGPEARVGLCFEASAGLIAALLGILKSGGAYVPLDPSLPAGRLVSMLEDSDAGALVVQEDLRGLLGKVEAPVVALDRDWNVLADERATA